MIVLMIVDNDKDNFYDNDNDLDCYNHNSSNDK